MNKEDLRNFMTAADLSASHIAVLCDRTRRTVQHWLAGKRIPTNDALVMTAVRDGLLTIDWVLKQRRR